MAGLTGHGPQSGTGWYRLKSGTVIHLQAGREPTPETISALDQIVQAAIRRMEWEREELQRWEDEGGRVRPEKPLTPLQQRLGLW